MTGCGILLDSTNVYITSRDLGGSAESFVQQLPSEHIREIHLVGYGTDRQARLVDDHAHAIQPEIWQLYEDAPSLAMPEYVIIERDASFPHIEDLLAEVARARGVPAAATSGARG
jgi:uncharacterized protein (UPF0276 family)